MTLSEERTDIRLFVSADSNNEYLPGLDKIARKNQKDVTSQSLLA